VSDPADPPESEDAPETLGPLFPTSRHRSFAACTQPAWMHSRLGARFDDVAATSLTHPGQHRRFTADEVTRMVEAGVLREDEPLELLGGELIVVTPQGPAHADAATALRDLFVEAYRGKGVVVRDDKPLAAGPVDLPEPDLAVVHGRRGSFADRHPRGDEAVLVVELARTSLALDRSKAAVYAAGGVAVYWLVDMQTRRIEVHTEPRADGRYAAVRVLSEDDAAELPGGEATVRARDFLA
jgi:Uma2 family endonuclease